MKIVHIQHPFIHNQGYQENYLPRRQSNLGHDVSLVTSNIVPSKFRDQTTTEISSGRYVKDGVRVVRLPSVSLHDAVTYSRGVAQEIRRENPDIVHSHRLISAHTIQSLVGNQLSDTKIFFDCHVDNDNFHLDSWYESLGFKAYKNTIIPLAQRAAEAIIAVNPHCIDFLRQQCGVSSDLIRFLPLGADTEQFYSSETAGSRIREGLGYADEDIVFIFAGNVSPTKDVENLLKSFSDLDLPQKQLLILGEGGKEYMQYLEEIVHDEDITDKTTFHEFVPHEKLYEYYNAADVGVWPGKLGITIIEAIACGLPVILSKNAATEFLLEENGLSYTRGDVSDLTSKMYEYGNNSELRNQAAISAESLVSRELSWNKVARKSIEIYNE